MKPNPLQNANLAGAFLTRQKLVFGRSLLGFFCAYTSGTARIRLSTTVALRICAACDQTVAGGRSLLGLLKGFIAAFKVNWHTEAVFVLRTPKNKKQNSKLKQEGKRTAPD